MNPNEEALMTEMIERIRLEEATQPSSCVARDLLVSDLQVHSVSLY